LLATYGVLHFRDFSIDAKQYSDFLNKLCRKVTLDPARKFVTKSAQLVDSGLEEMPLHSENSLTPFVPDLLGFFCEIPAASGSQTTYCDGQAVWKELPEEMKHYFSSHTFYFKRTLPKKLWQNYLRNFLSLSEETPITKEMVDSMIAALPQHKFELLENEDLVADLNVALVHPSFFSKELAFCNSLIGPSYNYEKPIARDENGVLIPEHYYHEFKKISDNLTREISWKKDDMVLIDNTRYMHGRRKIEDPTRKIYAGMGLL
jgi:alpha-ketoglutarate-dependent taurine dioxygenase